MTPSTQAKRRPSASSSLSRDLRRLFAPERVRVGATFVLYSLLAGLATFTNARGQYVDDNRFELYWAPAGRIFRETGLWDASRGIGRVGEELWPNGYPMALLRGLGLSPQTTEHLWHAVVLVVAGLGVVLLLRVWQPRLGAAHVVAGLAYMFNPLTATFLLPSVLFWNYAMAPWLLLCLLRGVVSRHPWRWAAAFALLLFSAGNADLPGTFFALLWLVPGAIWLVMVDRSATWRSVFTWLARAAVLAALTCAAAMAKTLLGSEPLAQRLQYTELPERVNSTSSWAESWRGLGFWLSYFSDPSGAARLPGGTYYYENPLGVLVTFIAPCVALAMLWRTRWRPRILLLAITLLSLVFMVGAFPPDDPSPFGRLLLRAYDWVPGLASIRTTYKAGSGLMIGVAVLFGMATVVAVTAVGRRRPQLRAVPIAVAAVVILATSLPFWNGGLYAEQNRMEDIPDYWQDALSYLDAQPGNGRVLILPGATKTAYRWGEPGDDIFDATMRRHPNVISTAFPLSGDLSANLVDALEARIAEGTLEPGMIEPVARALGIEWIVLRNDLDWELSQVARPNELATIRQDPAIERAEDFGEPGTNTTTEDDTSPAAAAERQLAPVEVFHVPAAAACCPPGENVLARPATQPLLVSGDGGAWFPMASEDLFGGHPVEYTADLSPAELTSRLEDGAPLVITDTNRRRLTRIRGAVPTQSHTLSEGQDLDQEAQDLFDVPGSQSTAFFEDAERIDASSSGVRLIGFQPWLRPANAFDHDEATTWLTGGFEDPVGAFLRVDFREPIEIGELTLQPYRPASDGRQVSEVSLGFSDGHGRQTVALEPDGPTTVTFEPRRTTYLDLRIEGLDPDDGTAAVGFREITIPGVDLAEIIDVPDDVVRAAADDPDLAAALEDAPLTYLFDRVRGAGPQDEEKALRRGFEVPSNRAFDLTGQASVDQNTPEQVLDRLLRQLHGDEVGAYGSSRSLGAVNNRGGLAVDGDPATAWGAVPANGETLTIEFPSQTVDRIEITAPNDAQSSSIDRVTVSAAGQSAEVDLDSGDCSTPPCPATGVAELPPVTTDQVLVRIERVQPRSGSGGAFPARISEVAISGQGGAPVRTTPLATDAPTECATGLLGIDGTPTGVRFATGAAVNQLLNGETTEFESCEPVTLGPARHDLRAPSSIVDRVRLSDGEAPVGPDHVVAPVDVIRSGRGEVRLHVESDDALTVSTGQSYDPGWRASVDGEDLGAPVAVNTLSAWEVPPGAHEITMTFAPERTYRLAVATTLTGLVLCAAILLWPRPRRTPT